VNAAPHRLLLIATLLLVAVPVAAQVPGILNYQGRVAVGTVNFDGSGTFKFALVNTDGSTTYWSNDGSSASGNEPTTAVTLTVTKGLYNVLLGDTTLTNMTAIPASVFTNADVRLRVWFNDGTHGSQLLTPDQRLAAVGYALMAGSVPSGAITSSMIATGAVQSANIATGTISADKLASGGTTLSTTSGDTALLGQGYIQVQSSGITDLTTIGSPWLATSTTSAPTALQKHTQVWTGSEMIVWGGLNDTTWFNSGGRYNPTTDTWAVMTATGAPSARAYHTAVWTGSEMIIWGGLEWFWRFQHWGAI